MKLAQAQAHAGMAAGRPIEEPSCAPRAPWLDCLPLNFADEIKGIDAALVSCFDGFEKPDTHYGMLRYHFGYADSGLQPLSRDAYLPRGKRLRPLICMLFCRMFGLAPGTARVVMMATEVMHAASLVHDDIEDRDAVRWNRPTLQAVFGQEQAINAGDALIGLVYKLLLGLRAEGVTAEALLEVIEAFNQAHLQMCEGQHLDLRHRHASPLTIDEYFDMAERKTGAACICIAKAIGVLAGLNAGTQQTLTAFGQSLGVLYQICDDVRGIWGEPDELGREVGHDVIRQRPSLPLLYAGQHGSDALRLALATAPDREQVPNPTELAFIRQGLVACGAGQFCRTEATRHYGKALAALVSLGKDGAEARVLQGVLAACFASVEALV